MGDQNTGRKEGVVSRKIVRVAITIVLAFFALPIVCAILYGGGAMAMGGLGILAILIAVQYPLMRLLVRRKK